MQTMDSSFPTRWQHLAPKPGSAYRQLFVQGTRIAARLLYGLTVNDEPMSPEEVAAAYNLPLAAIQEAIAYCESNPPELEADWRREESRVQARESSDPSAV